MSNDNRCIRSVKTNCAIHFRYLIHIVFCMALSFFMKLIPLTQGAFSIVDDCDFDELMKHKWHLSIQGRRRYARRFEKSNSPDGPRQKVVYMHRQIMNTEKGVDTDHKFGDGLDNRRKNLRICTRSQNMQNMKKRLVSVQTYKGIYKTSNGKYAARLWHNGVKLHIGTYDTPEAAARAYDKKAKELFGEFANLNFPNE